MIFDNYENTTAHPHVKWVGASTIRRDGTLTDCTTVRDVKLTGWSDGSVSLTYVLADGTELGVDTTRALIEQIIRVSDAALAENDEE